MKGLKKLLNKTVGGRGVPAAGQLTEEIVQQYFRSRSISSPKYLCHAPFNNMYFNSEGHVANCWLTFNDPEVYTPERTIREIWNGPRFTSLRELIKAGDLSRRCKTCEGYLLHKNFVTVLARAYDNETPLIDFPTLMEFELTNDCNLECTMCNGLLSSSIRAHREHLPPLPSPYGDKFVEELKEFIPHLTEARFNGGEPFIIKIYYKIWDQVFKLNPGLRMVVATNGSVLNTRVKDYLSRGNFHINLSIDGFKKETYESIRVNADHGRLMQNFEYFLKYCKDHRRTLCIMINPMRQNWREMPDFVNWCNAHEIHLWFNSIMHPEDQSLWNLPADQLRHIYETLSSAPLNPFSGSEKSIYQYNIRTYKNLVENQIKTWMVEAEQASSGGGKATAKNTLRPEAFKAAWFDYFKQYRNSADAATQWEKLQLLIGSIEKADRNEVMAYFASLPIQGIAEALEKETIPVLREKLMEALRANGILSE